MMNLVGVTSEKETIDRSVALHVQDISGGERVPLVRSSHQRRFKMPSPFVTKSHGNPHWLLFNPKHCKRRRACKWYHRKSISWGVKIYLFIASCGKPDTITTSGTVYQTQWYWVNYNNNNNDNIKISLQKSERFSIAKAQMLLFSN